MKLPFSSYGSAESNDREERAQMLPLHEETGEAPPKRSLKMLVHITLASVFVVAIIASVLVVKEKSASASVSEDTSIYFDDDELSGLLCADFDDDDVYPSHFCNYGDSKVCQTDVKNNSNYNSFCGTTCSTTEMHMVHEGVTKTSEYVNASWAVVCGWEAIADMQNTCAGTFSPVMPTGSQNVDPEYIYSTAPKDATVNGKSYDACNLHAFCQTCSSGGVVSSLPLSALNNNNF